MSELPTFGARLARLLKERATSAAAVAATAGLPADQLDAVLAGEDPDDQFLRRVAPAVGLHSSDLYLFAARTVPEDLAPAQLDGPWEVGGLLKWQGYNLSAHDRARLRRFVDEMPTRPVMRTRPFPHDIHQATPGVILHRLLSNRNIGINATVLMVIGGGPYLSTSTYMMALGGEIPLDDEYVNAFARTVGIAIGDLAALLGIEARVLPWTLQYPWPSDLVELAWAARRLDDEQLLAAIDFADALRDDAA